MPLMPELAQNAGLPMKVPVKIIIPSSQYPWLEKVVPEIFLKCRDCSKVMERPFMVPFLKCDFEPLSGPAMVGKASSSVNGMYCTRMSCFCPQCGAPLETGEERGIFDLLKVPRDYKRPPDMIGNTGASVVFDGAENRLLAMQSDMVADAPAAVATRGEDGEQIAFEPIRSTRPKKAYKKKSDLNRAPVRAPQPAPAPLAAQPSGKRAPTPQEQALAKAALERASGLLPDVLKENATKAPGWQGKGTPPQGQA